MVARLTTWQMLAFRAAQGKRIERASKDAPGPDAGPTAPAFIPTRPPPREVLVADYMAMGRSREQAEELYDRQTAEWRAGRDTH